MKLRALRAQAPRCAQIESCALHHTYSAVTRIRAKTVLCSDFSPVRQRPASLTYRVAVFVRAANEFVRTHTPRAHI